MYLVTINPEVCGGCGQCAEACPSQIISMVDTKAAVTGDTAECLGCEACVVICEAKGIKLEEF